MTPKDRIEKFIGEIVDAVKARGADVSQTDQYINHLRALVRGAPANDCIAILLRRTLEIAEADKPLKQRMNEITNMLMEAAQPQTESIN